MKVSEPIVISLGGSLIVPDEIDTMFLSAFRNLIKKQVEKGRRFLIVTGGGASTRRYQRAAREVYSELNNEDLDWIGIYINHLNGHLLSYILKDVAGLVFIGDPRTISTWDDPVLVVGGGWKPGATSDYVTVEAAHAVGAGNIINLSNITHVYSDDPKTNKNAKKFSELSWNKFRGIIPSEMSPGINAPFDPIASEKAQEYGLTVAVMSSDLENLEKYLDGGEFEGTLIS